jgi:hypothetical protein
LESGEYFEDEKMKRQKAKAEVAQRRAEKATEKKKQREAVFKPPEVSLFLVLICSIWSHLHLC